MPKLAPEVEKRVKDLLEGKSKPQEVIYKRVKHTTITVGDLKALLAANPNHPISKSLENKGFHKLPDTTRLVMHEPDVRALMENLEVVTERESTSPGVVTETKKTK